MDVRLLIVDDEEEVRRSLVSRLDDPAFEVVTADDGRRAIDLVRQRDFDVVLLDVLMPGVDGLATLEEIKRLRPSTEVIFLTGHASVGEALDGLGKGAFDYVLRSVPLSELKRRITSACETRRFNQQLAGK